MSTFCNTFKIAQASVEKLKTSHSSATRPSSQTEHSFSISTMAAKLLSERMDCHLCSWNHWSSRWLQLKTPVQPHHHCFISGWLCYLHQWIRQQRNKKQGCSCSCHYRIPSPAWCSYHHQDERKDFYQLLWRGSCCHGIRTILDICQRQPSLNLHTLLHRQ